MILFEKSSKRKSCTTERCIDFVTWKTFGLALENFCYRSCNVHLKYRTHLCYASYVSEDHQIGYGFLQAQHDIFVLAVSNAFHLNGNG